MARSEARILTSVWSNPDFCTLTRSAQGLYWMLLSQPEVSLAGVVPFVERRWHKLSSSPRDTLDTDLDELERGGFVIVDDDTGEVFIRTFVKHDGVLRSPKTRAAMWSAYRNILSPRIRDAFLNVVGDDHRTEATKKGWISDPRDRRADTPSDTPSDGVPPVDNPPPDTPSDTPPDTPADRARARARADSDSDTDSDTDTETETREAKDSPQHQVDETRAHERTTEETFATRTKTNPNGAIPTPVAGMTPIGNMLHQAIGGPR